MRGKARVPERKVVGKLVAAMQKAGFPAASHALLSERPIGKMIYQPSELVFNRALDRKSSSFCVLATIENDGSVAVHWYNPDPKGTMFKKNEFLRKFVLPPNASSSSVEDVVGRVAEDARKKNPGILYLEPHTHMGAYAPRFKGPDGKHMGGGYVKFDDGISYLTDNLRKALFYHIDYYALSSHNSFSKGAFDLMSWAGRHLGFLPIRATELTSTLRPPNGPHILVFMRNARAAELLEQMVLSKREEMDMPSYFTGMEMDEMLDALFSLQQANLAVLGIAHSVNFNSPRIPVPMVGLYSAVETGALTLDEAHEIARRFDSIAMWNTSLWARADEMEITNPELREFLKTVNRKHIGNRRLWVNQTNYAVAEEIHERFGLYTHFETDEHKTLPFVRRDGRPGYVLGGDSCAAGATVIKIPEHKFTGRPSVPELIDMIRSRTVKMYGRVFAVKRKEAITTYKERSAIPDGLRRIVRRAEHALTRRYGGMLARDFFDLLFSGDFKDLGNMRGE
jgi:hypothetical protein